MRIKALLLESFPDTTTALHHDTIVDGRMGYGSRFGFLWIQVRFRWKSLIS